MASEEMLFFFLFLHVESLADGFDFSCTMNRVRYEMAAGKAKWKHSKKALNIMKKQNRIQDQP